MRDDPEMVVRLVTKAKDKKGKDMYERSQNDAKPFLDGFNGPSKGPMKS